MKLKKLSCEFFIFAFFKDVAVCAAIAIGLGFMAVKFGAAEGEWAKFLLFLILAAAFGYFSSWSGKNLLRDIEKQDAEKRFCEVNFFLLKRESEECLNKALHGIDSLDGNKSTKTRTLMRY